MLTAVARGPSRTLGWFKTADLLLLADERLVAAGAAANANTALSGDHRVVANIEAGMARAFPTASVVVVTYNNLDYTRACLRSVLENSAYPGTEVLVVDNASQDGTRDYLRSLAVETGVKVILNDDNRGFARAVNQGLAAAVGERLVVLNNDTLAPDGWLPRLLRHLARPEIGLVVATTSFAGNEAMVPIDSTSASRSACSKTTTTRSACVRPACAWYAPRTPSSTTSAAPPSVGCQPPSTRPCGTTTSPSSKPSGASPGSPTASGRRRAASRPPSPSPAPR